MTTPQREIKFRAWDKKNNSMITEVICIGWCAIGGSRGGQSLNHIEGLEGSVRMDTQNLILLQHTGWKDRGEADVWEGDVLRIYYAPRDHYATVVVEYNDTETVPGWYLRLLEQDSDSGWDILQGGRWVNPKNWLNKSEVIGNRYSNPELIPTNEPNRQTHRSNERN